MSNTSYSFKENSHVIVNQGGEKKVMKKILSVALSTAMAFSMFASVAFGADAKLTPEQQFNALKEAGIVSGFPDGLSHLERTLTRAELAKIIVNSLSLEPVDATSYNDKNYANHWGRPYIEAATQAGILNGKDAVKKLFDPNGAVTVQELAKVLVTALKLEVPADADNTASAWAKGYVAAAVNAGYLADGINYQAQATRSQAVVAAYAIYEAAQGPKVKSYNVVDSKNIEFTLTNDEVVKVTLETALEPNKETEVTFKTADGKEITTTVTWVVTDATKVESVSADNLKEVVVKFDGEVDKATAELKDNYKLSAGKTIKSAVLNDAKNAVTLTLEDEVSLQNQVKYSLTVSGVKAGSKTISASNIEFSPVDNKIPEVVSVAGLGTKAVKVVFSEPVKQSYTGSFLLDGQGFYGSLNVDNREMIIKSTTDLTVGEHTLTVSGVEDFHGFKSLKSEHKFTVVEDNTPPTIAEATGTLEKLTVTFSEDVDDSTVDIANVYHKRGDSKIIPSKKVKLSGNKYEFYFDKGNALPSYETTIYVEGVKDYSGNEIKETSKLVKAEIDTERPTVVDVKVTTGNKKQLAITFSKDIEDNQKWAELITVKDKDGKIQNIASAGFKDSNSKNILLVNFFSDLPEGTNTLEIRGIKDNTVLGNVMLDYSTTFSVSDSGKPNVASASFKIDSTARRAVIVFSEKMDTASLANKANYILKFKGELIGLPSDASINISQDGKAVYIDLPVQINGEDVTAANWTDIIVQAVKDASGNYLDGFKAELNIDKYSRLHAVAYNLEGNTAVLSGTKEIKVKFDQAVSKVKDKSTIKVNGVEVAGVVTNDTEIVTLKLPDTLETYTSATITDIEFRNTVFVNVAQNEVYVDTDPATVTGDKVVTISSGIKDDVAPVVKPLERSTDKVLYYAGTRTATSDTYEVTIETSEDLQNIPALYNLYASDLVVTRLSDGKVIPVDTNTDADPASQDDVTYTVRISGKDIIVTIRDTKGTGSEYFIAVKSDAKYIQDLNGKVIAEKGAIRTSLQ
jgi:hypothetical protein